MRRRAGGGADAGAVWEGSWVWKPVFAWHWGGDPFMGTVALDKSVQVRHVGLGFPNRR